MTTDLSAMLARLDAYVWGYEGPDEDANLNLAVGAAAALRYALTGEIDSTIANILAIAEESN